MTALPAAAPQEATVSESDASQSIRSQAAPISRAARKAPWHRDPVLSKLFLRIDPAVADSFTEDQILAMRQILAPQVRTRRKGVEFLMPWAGRRYFLALSWGRDLRKRRQGGLAQIAPGRLALYGAIGCAALVFAGLALLFALN